MSGLLRCTNHEALGEVAVLAWISTVPERPNIRGSARRYAVMRSGNPFHQGTATG